MILHDPLRRTRTRTRAARAAVGGAVVTGFLVLLAGCGGDGVTAGPAASPVAATTPASTTTPPSTTTPTTETATTPTTGGTSAGSPSSAPGDGGGAAAPGPTTAPPAAPEEEAEGSLEPPRDAGTGPSEQEATGGGLSVVDVRTGRHDGFDRVVIELAGEEGDEPGWYARYVDEPTQEGSGAPLRVEGSSYLAVAVRGLGYPFDTGQDEVVGSFAGEGTAVVREVLVGAVVEGQAQVVLGLEAQAPYAITRLSDPPRVVVDVLG